LALTVLLALTPRFLTILMSLSVGGTLGCNTYLSVGTIEITAHQQQDEYNKKENKGKET
jgi:hypothetical protein